MLRQLTLDDALAQLEECAAARRELLKENIRLRRELEEKDKLLAQREQMLEEMGAQLQQAQHAQDDVTWRKRLDKVSYKRLSTPKKKTLSTLRDMFNKLPRREDGSFLARVQAVANDMGVHYDTAQRNIAALESDGLIERLHEGNGEPAGAHKDSLYIKINPKVLANPSNIDKMISIGKIRAEEKAAQWGGDHRKPEGKTCSNCGAPETYLRGFRHDSYQCDACGIYSDDRYALPLEEESAAPAPLEVVQAEMLAAAEEVQRPAAAEQKLPPFPDRPCVHCHRPQRVCFAMSPDGKWDFTCTRDMWIA